MPDNGGHRRGTSSPQLTGAFDPAPEDLAPAGPSLHWGGRIYSSRSSLFVHCNTPLPLCQPRKPLGPINLKYWRHKLQRFYEHALLLIAQWRGVTNLIDRNECGG